MRGFRRVLLGAQTAISSTRRCSKQPPDTPLQKKHPGTTSLGEPLSRCRYAFVCFSLSSGCFYTGFGQRLKVQYIAILFSNIKEFKTVRSGWQKYPRLRRRGNEVNTRSAVGNQTIKYLGRLFIMSRRRKKRKRNGQGVCDSRKVTYRGVTAHKQAYPGKITHLLVKTVY